MLLRNALMIWTAAAGVLPKSVMASISLKYLEDQIVAKVYAVATRGGIDANGEIPTPTMFPEWVGENETEYNYHDVTDWTAGFFGGTLYQLYARSLTKPLLVSSEELLYLARKWSDPLASQRFRTDTHDLGFMLFTSIGQEARLLNNQTAKEMLLDASHSLAKRYNPIVKSIRSWGAIDDTTDFQVIIDNMINLEMLYWTALEFDNATLHEIAENHALTTMQNHFRGNFSTWHVISYDQFNGSVTRKYTSQGYADWSTWARGQAWSIYGTALSYNYTRNRSFLSTSHRAADYFLSQLHAETPDGVPYWDFDAPEPGPRDTSAAMAVASGLLYMIRVDETGRSKEKYLEAAVGLVRDAVRLSLSPPAVWSKGEESGTLVVESSGWDSILMNGTINNNPNTPHTLRSANTGIVYAGYYLVEALNQLDLLGVELEL